MSKENRFYQMPFQTHRFLADVPLKSLYCVKLPGGREGMTIKEINEIINFTSGEEVRLGFVTTALFWLRGQIGRLFGWDDVPELVDKNSYLARLTGEERVKSLITPGQAEGISRILYCYENELLGEIINRTVHCFWLMASEPTGDGYNLYSAVYVKRLNWFTPVYMTLVTPMLKWIIYPSIMKSIKRRWEEAFPQATEKHEKTSAARA